MAESIGYKVVTTTGEVLEEPGTGVNWIIHGYSLKGSGAVASLSLADEGTDVMNIPALAAAGAASPNVFAPGVKFTGEVTLTGVSTNLTGFTVFYTKS